MNEQLINELRQLKIRHRELTTRDKLAETRELTPRIRELYRIIDWGFAKGELVERRTEHRWVEDVIHSFQDGEFRFHGVIVPPELIRKRTEKVEQMELF